MLDCFITNVYYKFIDLVVAAYNLVKEIVAPAVHFWTRGYYAYLCYWVIKEYYTYCTKKKLMYMPPDVTHIFTNGYKDNKFLSNITHKFNSSFYVGLIFNPFDVYDDVIEDTKKIAKEIEEYNEEVTNVSDKESLERESINFHDEVFYG